MGTADYEIQSFSFLENANILIWLPTIYRILSRCLNFSFPSYYYYYYLMLKRENVCDATIDRISNPSLSLVSNGDNGLSPVLYREMNQKLRDVAGPEHLVYSRELRSPLLRAEVRGEYAVRGTLPPQELACTTWRRRHISRPIYRWSHQPQREKERDREWWRLRHTRSGAEEDGRRVYKGEMKKEGDKVSLSVGFWGGT